MRINKLALASIISAKITIIYVVVITIVAEFSPALKSILKSLTGHHWTTKSLSSLALYLLLLVVIYLFIKTPSDSLLGKWIMRLFWTAIMGTLALLLFFVWHYIFS